GPRPLHEAAPAAPPPELDPRPAPLSRGSRGDLRRRPPRRPRLRLLRRIRPRRPLRAVRVAPEADRRCVGRGRPVPPPRGRGELVGPQAPPEPNLAPAALPRLPALRRCHPAHGHRRHRRQNGPRVAGHRRLRRGHRRTRRGSVGQDGSRGHPRTPALTVRTGESECSAMTRIVLRGGTVLNGSGGPAYEADVLVADGRIAEVGPSVDTTGARE